MDLNSKSGSSTSTDDTEVDKNTINDTGEESDPFTVSGGCSDEVVIEFDNEKELYVSRNFLRYASPVFKAMFDGGYKEEVEARIQLKGKSYEDMLELLECLHPAVMKPVDFSNALRIFPLADEYQMRTIAKRTEGVIRKWIKLLRSQNSVKVSAASQYKRCKECMAILTTALLLNRDDIARECVNVLSYCYYKATTGRCFCSVYVDVEDPKELREECGRLYDNLPDEIKMIILLSRLEKCDSNQEIMESAQALTQPSRTPIGIAFGSGQAVSYGTTMQKY